MPAELCAALQADPGIVAPAVAAFYERDPIDMKRCGTMRRFPFNTRVPVSVKMTRCLYAQLSQQRFEAAPKVFGVRPQPGTQLAKEFELGAKLALGFEILASRAHDAGFTAPAASMGGDGGDGGDGSASGAGGDGTHAPATQPQGARWDSFVAKLRSSG
jgi:hypothetical protein